MSRVSLALATAMLFAAFVALASSLPVAERQERHFDDSHGGTSQGASGSQEPSSASKEGTAPSEGTTSPSASSGGSPSGVAVAGVAPTGAAPTDAATSGTAESAGGISTENTSEPSGEVASTEPGAETTTSPTDDATASTSPADDEDASPSPSDEDADASPTDEDDDDGSVCFPADARVELKDGSTVSMDQLAIGDSVKVGVNQYSNVFMFTHRLATVSHRFIVLNTASGASLALTKGHYMYADGSLVAASEVKVGSTVSLGDGKLDTVVSVGSMMKGGLYNPQTVNGNVVVNNILASTYTTAVEPVFAHAVLSPFRFLHAIGLHFTALESGGGILADLSPRGSTI